jgi:YD repeat-containing protein
MLFLILSYQRIIGLYCAISLLNRKKRPADFLTHTWDYDALSRKTAIDVKFLNATVNGSLTPTYDGLNRLTEEALVISNDTKWDLEYGYDGAGNRTVLHNIDDNLQYLHYYGDVNREALVYGPSGWQGALAYDFRGNVTSRPPLAGGNAFAYTWDAYDRLTQSSRTGGATVGYKYDVGGRLLRRGSSASGTTYNYWLGLNKLAEERTVNSRS